MAVGKTYRYWHNMKTKKIRNETPKDLDQ